MMPQLNDQARKDLTEEQAKANKGMLAATEPAARPEITHQEALSQLAACEEELREVRGREETLHRTTTSLRALLDREQTRNAGERRRLVRALHDGPAQMLASACFAVAALQKHLDHPGNATDRVGAALALISGAIDGLRKLSSDLWPAVLDDLGLAAGLLWYTKNFESETGIRCRAELADDTAIDWDHAVTTFRIMQEALENVRRHSGAHEVVVGLRVEDRRLCLTVNDDGRGFRPGQTLDPQGLGLTDMHERARRWGGRVIVRAAGSRGTMVGVSIPLDMGVDNTPERTEKVA